MDYKKIAAYLVIILMALGYWYKTGLDEKRRQETYDRFAAVYASTTVLAEVYRTDSTKFFAARDSILTLYQVDSAWMDQFRQSLAGKEEEWSGVWEIIKRKSDSLIEYYKAHPRDSTAVDSVADTAKGDNGN